MVFSRLARLAWACLWLISSQGLAAAPPTAFEARYEVTAKGMHVATLTRVLRVQSDGRYEFTSELQSAGMLALVKPVNERETSRGRWVGTGLLPEHYEYSKRSGKKHRSARLTFDWASSRMSGQDGDRGWQAVLQPETTDKLTLQLLLMRDLAGDGGLEYRVADGEKVRLQTWQRLGREQIRSGGRSFDTIKVEYQGRSNRRTRLWCAAELGYLPVRIEYQEKGGDVTSALLHLP